MNNHKVLLLILFLLILFSSCSQRDNKVLIKNDLFGKPLSGEDFTVIYNDVGYRAFISEKECSEIFPNAKRKVNELWKWSSFDLSNGLAGFRNIEYQTDIGRFVYMKNISAEENIYVGLVKDVTTIRGVKIGDSINKVIERYGQNEWLKKHSDLKQKGNLAFSYKLYNYQNAKPKFDSIYFEFRDGVVVGIHYWKLQEDSL
jgi:hypothetical protein